MSVKRSLQDLCYLCRLDTVRARLRQWHSQLGTSVETLNTSYQLFLLWFSRNGVLS